MFDGDFDAPLSALACRSLDCDRWRWLYCGLCAVGVSLGAFADAVIGLYLCRDISGLPGVAVIAATVELIVVPFLGGLVIHYLGEWARS